VDGSETAGVRASQVRSAGLTPCVAALVMPGVDQLYLRPHAGWSRAWMVGGASVRAGMSL